MRRCVSWLTASLLLAELVRGFVGPGAAEANAGPPPTRPGDHVGEPWGELAGIVIEHETLTLDLRPLTAHDPASIEAQYQLRNDGPPRRIDLVFVAEALVRESGGVWFDEQSVGASAEDTLVGLLPDSG